MGSGYDLVVVTSRQHAIQDLTLDWIDRNFPGIFQEVFFGNHWALEGVATKKSDICRWVEEGLRLQGLGQGQRAPPSTQTLLPRPLSQPSPTPSQASPPNRPVCNPLKFRSIGASVLIDDNPGYALDCAEAGINVLLFDWDLSYPWSQERRV